MGEPRALVVDDEPLFRTQFTDLLRERGVAVDPVDSGEAAIGRVEESAYDVVFLDLLLPKMSGQVAHLQSLLLRTVLV